jgi:hypothetical protein
MSNDYVPIIKDYPVCFNSGTEYGLWVQSARQAPPTPGHGYCEDCTPEYQAQMLEQDRCKYPDTIFRGDGGVRSKLSASLITGRAVRTPVRSRTK